MLAKHVNTTQHMLAQHTCEQKLLTHIKFNTTDMLTKKLTQHNVNIHVNTPLRDLTLHEEVCLKPHRNCAR